MRAELTRLTPLHFSKIRIDCSYSPTHSLQSKYDRKESVRFYKHVFRKTNDDTRKNSRKRVHFPRTRFCAFTRNDTLIRLSPRLVAPTNNNNLTLLDCAKWKKGENTVEGNMEGGGSDDESGEKRIFLKCILLFVRCFLFTIINALHRTPRRRISREKQ